MRIFIFYGFLVLAICIRPLEAHEPICIKDSKALSAYVEANPFFKRNLSLEKRLEIFSNLRTSGRDFILDLLLWPKEFHHDSMGKIKSLWSGFGENDLLNNFRKNRAAPFSDIQLTVIDILGALGSAPILDRGDRQRIAENLILLFVPSSENKREGSEELRIHAMNALTQMSLWDPNLPVHEDYEGNILAATASILFETLNGGVSEPDTLNVKLAAVDAAEKIILAPTQISQKNRSSLWWSLTTFTTKLIPANIPVIQKIEKDFEDPRLQITHFLTDDDLRETEMELEKISREDIITYSEADLSRLMDQFREKQSEREKFLGKK